MMSSAPDQTTAEISAKDILYGDAGGKDPARLERERRRSEREAAKARHQELLQTRKPKVIANCEAIAQARRQVDELTEEAEDMADSLERYAEATWRALPESKQAKQANVATHNCEVQFDRYDPETETLYFDWYYNYDQEYEGRFWITLDQLAAAPKKIRDAYTG